MASESALDLRYNISALVIAILRTDIKTPEQAFAVVADKEHLYTKEDTEDMKKLKAEGMTYEEIGEFYGISKYTVFNKVKGRRA